MPTGGGYPESRALCGLGPPAAPLGSLSGPRRRPAADVAIQPIAQSGRKPQLSPRFPAQPERRRPWLRKPGVSPSDRDPAQRCPLLGRGSRGTSRQQHGLGSTACLVVAGLRTSLSMPFCCTCAALVARAVSAEPQAGSAVGGAQQRSGARAVGGRSGRRAGRVRVRAQGGGVVAGAPTLPSRCRTPHQRHGTDRPGGHIVGTDCRLRRLRRTSRRQHGPGSTAGSVVAGLLTCLATPCYCSCAVRAARAASPAGVVVGGAQQRSRARGTGAGARGGRGGRGRGRGAVGLGQARLSSCLGLYVSCMARKDHSSSSSSAPLT